MKKRIVICCGAVLLLMAAALGSPAETKETAEGEGALVGMAVTDSAAVRVYSVQEDGEVRLRYRWERRYDGQR